MDWQTKATILGVLDRIPFRDQLHYFMQRNVTRSLPRQPKQEYFDVLDWHRDVIVREVGPLDTVRLFEFGAGWDLFYNVYLYASGVPSQTLVDLNSYAKVDLINHEIARCQATNDPRFVRKPEVPIAKLADLSRLGITYMAPCDARQTPLKDAAFNVVISTNTMEHIPFADLEAILAECYRLLEPGGIVSAKVDYADHYSYVDRTIGPYNYMTFDDADWRRFNPDSHFQNRGRHSGYVQLFEGAGFDLISNEPLFEYPDAEPPPPERRAERFRDLSAVDLRATGGRFCARKPLHV